MTANIAVVGLWHLGCSIAASWSGLGHSVQAVDFSDDLVGNLRQGEPPIYEPGLAEAWKSGLSRGNLRVGTDPSAVSGSKFIFIAYDTPVRDDDTSDISPIEMAIERIGPSLDNDAIVIISAQLPVGTSVSLRERLKTFRASIELAYSPENLRLGEAIKCYLEPGHIVIGAETRETAQAVERLFAPMNARTFSMSLTSSEMVKHCINSFLATSVTMANQWSDIASAMGADFATVVPALRADPRIGERAYITPGIGFSGGTLGRDLKVLDTVNRDYLDGKAPLFGQVWKYNLERASMIAQRVAEIVGTQTDARVALLGMTYKPGTSTLRRSLPLAIASELTARQLTVRVHDPRANWTEVDLPRGLRVSDSAYAAAEDADLVLLLTEWGEYRELDFGKLAQGMRTRHLLDPKGFLRACESKLSAAGFVNVPLVPPSEGVTA